jgi:multiple sugar transport system substrate-binding protein
MRRRIAPVATLVASILALTVGLGACGDDGGSSNSTKSGDQAKLGGTVKLWIMPNGPKPKEDMDALLKPFTEQTGVKVDTEVVGWDVQFDRIRNAAVSGEGPDVTQAGTTQVPFFAALGGFEDISKRVEDVGGEAAYPKGVWQTTQVVGQDGTWALPWFTEARAIYYRKDVLKKAGVDEATALTRSAPRWRRSSRSSRSTASRSSRSAHPARRRSTSSTT